MARGGGSAAYKRNCERELSQVVPTGLSRGIALHEWASLHNLFVLTDRGGFQFGYGLSSAVDRRDHVNILSVSQWRREEWEKHRGREPLCIIEG